MWHYVGKNLVNVGFIFPSFKENIVVRFKMILVPSSKAFLSHEWFVYDEAMQIESIHFLKQCTLVSNITISLFCGSMKLIKQITDKNSAEFKVDNWLCFSIDKEVSHFNNVCFFSDLDTLHLSCLCALFKDFESLFTLRQKWYHTLLKKLKLQELTKNDEVNHNKNIIWLT